MVIRCSLCSNNFSLKMVLNATDVYKVLAKSTTSCDVFIGTRVELISSFACDADNSFIAHVCCTELGVRNGEFWTRNSWNEIELMVRATRHDLASSKDRAQLKPQVRKHHPVFYRISSLRQFQKRYSEERLTGVQVNFWNSLSLESEFGQLLLNN